MKVVKGGRDPERTRLLSAKYEDRSDEWLLARYRRTGDLALRDLLVERFRPVVERLARRLSQRLPPMVDRWDLVHAGFSGLIQAIERFDARKGRRFAPFMLRRVRGSMLDEARAADWLPRLLRERLTRRERVVRRLRHEMGCEPAEEDVAEALSLTMEEYREQYSVPSTISGLPGSWNHGGAGRDGDGDGDEGKGGVEDLLDPHQENPLEDIYRQEILEQVHAILTPAERKMVRLHYFDGLKFCEVARRMKRSPSRICQMHGSILRKLRDRLAPHASPDGGS